MLLWSFTRTQLRGADMKICTKTELAQAILWATAILAAAILDAPLELTLFLLPMLAFAALTGLRSGRTRP